MIAPSRRAPHVAFTLHVFRSAIPDDRVSWMDEPFTAVVLMGAVASLALGAYFWRLAPAVPIALAGGLAGQISGLIAWVFSAAREPPAADLIDGGLQASFGNALPAAARGFTVGMVIVGLVSLSLGRPPNGSRRGLRRAAIGIVGVGVVSGCLSILARRRLRLEG